MKPVTFVICAAGQGTRFKDHGITQSKPMIKLNGKTMLERSLDSLELLPQDQLIIISQKSDNLPSAFSQLKQVEWLEISAPTHGQLDTFLLAKNLLKHDDIVIYNCDTFFTCSELRNLIESDKFSGIIPCSIQPGLSWSFCKVGADFNVTEVAEKNRISDWASVGYYYFKGKDQLLKLAMLESQNPSAKESYVAPLYNRYLSAGLKVRVAQVQTFLPFGTIDQVKDYWDVSLKELIGQNC